MITVIKYVNPSTELMDVLHYKGVQTYSEWVHTSTCEQMTLPIWNCGYLLVVAYFPPGCPSPRTISFPGSASGTVHGHTRPYTVSNQLLLEYARCGDTCLLVASELARRNSDMSYDQALVVGRHVADKEARKARRRNMKAERRSEAKRAEQRVWVQSRREASTKWDLTLAK